MVNEVRSIQFFMLERNHSFFFLINILQDEHEKINPNCTFLDPLTQVI